MCDQPPTNNAPDSTKAHRGRPCPKCGRATRAVGRYRLLGGHLHRVSGDDLASIGSEEVSNRDDLAEEESR